jgi:hypothetical protein
MKVLKKGRGVTVRSKKMTCVGDANRDGCGAVLLVSPDDIKSETFLHYDANHWFVCPECGAETYVDAEDFK